MRARRHCDKRLSDGRSDARGDHRGRPHRPDPRRGLRAFPQEARIVALADINEETARSAAGELGVDGWYTDYHEMLARDDIDLVSVCTPPFEHARNSIDALNAGKHVYCEKPMAGSLRECDAMIEAARASGRSLSQVFQYRYRRDVLLAKALIDEGMLGRIFFGKMDMLWWRARSYYDLWWRGTWEKECGGVTINHAVHAVDTYLWLMGQLPESVTADMGTFTHDVEVEDLSIAMLRFPDGALGQLTSTVCLPQSTERFEICGDEAAVTLPWGVHAARERGRGMASRDVAKQLELREWAEARVPEPEHVGHAAQVQDVLAAVREGRDSAVTGEEGRRSIELIAALYKAAITGERVRLPISEDDSYYGKVSEAMADDGPSA